MFPKENYFQRNSSEKGCRSTPAEWMFEELGQNIMHELSVTQNILNIALHHAEGQRISTIHVVVGQLSSMVDDSVQFYWDIISQGTNAQGARLQFETVPAQMQCLHCGTCYPLSGLDFCCPRCGSANVHVVNGKEFYVDSIEIEHEAESELGKDQ